MAAPVPTDVVSSATSVSGIVPTFNTRARPARRSIPPRLGRTLRSYLCHF